MIGWAIFAIVILVLLALDLGVWDKQNREPTLRSAAIFSALYIAIGVGFAGVVYALYLERGGDVATKAAVDYLAAYALEKSLSLDNLFVIALLMQGLAVPRQDQHRVLFWGIITAVVLRGLMITGGLYLVGRFSWLFYLFGAYLAYAGAKLLWESDDDEAGPPKWVEAAHKYLPITNAAPQGRFIVREDGKRYMTVLALALVAVEGTDVIFALDSVPAVLSVSNDTFIALTSNIFAILGLRALYLVLAASLLKFRFLKHALAVVLIFVGGKMIAHDWVHLPNWLALGVILVSMTLGFIASIALPRRGPMAEAEESVGRGSSS